jgi:SAM-dependent methyltransferase
MQNIEISTADNDVRYVPGKRVSFVGIAHESRYQWVTEKWDLTESTVLDFGCGSGYGVHMLAKKAKTVIGIDYSITAIEFAEKIYGASNIKFLNLDACANDIFSNFGKNSFDVIVSFDVIEHIEKYFDYLNNILKLIKPDGVLIIGCPNRLQTFNWNNYWNSFHFQEFSPYQFRKIFSWYFDIVELYSQDFKDKRKREDIRLSLISKKNIIKNLLAEVLPYNILNFLVKINQKLNHLHNHRGGYVALDINDIEFKLEPKTEILEDAFGLIAVCKNPKKIIGSG